MEDSILINKKTVSTFFNVLYRLLISGCLIFNSIVLVSIYNSIQTIGYQQAVGLNALFGSGTQTGTQNQTSQTTTDYTKFESQLAATDYFKQHTKTVKAPEELLNFEDKEYYIYFYQPGCSACQYTDAYLIQYIDLKGYEQIGNLYFIDSSGTTNNWMWSSNGQKEYTENISLDNLRLQGTPTMVRIKKDKTIDIGIGVDDCLKMLGFLSK